MLDRKIYCLNVKTEMGVIILVLYSVKIFFWLRKLAKFLTFIAKLNEKINAINNFYLKLYIYKANYLIINIILIDKSILFFIFNKAICHSASHLVFIQIYKRDLKILF